jgi:hypothetical protein
MNMKISSRVTPLPLPPTEAVKPGRTSNTGPTSRGLPAAYTTAARSLFTQKLGGFHANALSAGLRLFSDSSVKNAMAHVKSAVTSLSGSVVNVLAAVTGRASQAAPGPEPQVPRHSIAQDPGFGAAFDKWVKDNNFEGTKPAPAKFADDAVSRTRVELPNTQSAPGAAAMSLLGDFSSARAREPERQAPPRSIAHDPGFGAAFDQWVKDNNFEGTKPAPAKPAQTTARPVATDAPLIDIEAPAPRTSEPPAKAPAQPPAPAAAQVQQEQPTPEQPKPVSVSTRPAQPPAASVQTQPTPVSVQPQAERPKPVSVRTRPAQPPAASVQTQPSPVSVQPQAERPKPVSVRTRPAQPPAASVQTQPSPVSVQPQAERPKPVSVRTRPAQPPAASVQTQPSPVSVRPQPEQPKPGSVPPQPEQPKPASVHPQPEQPKPASVHPQPKRPKPAAVHPEPEQPKPVSVRPQPELKLADSPTAALLDRKQELNSSQSELLSLMSQMGEKSKVKTSADNKTAAGTATPSAATEAAPTEPQGKVYTDPVAFARARDKWERDNHFDYDNPMPDGHVSEPRPEFKSPTFAARNVAAPPPAEAGKTSHQAEIDSHQAAIDAGYR